MIRLIQITKGFFRRENSSSGQALVEAAIATPIALIIIGGVMQFALIVIGRMGATYAAYRAGRAILTYEATYDSSNIYFDTSVNRWRDRITGQFRPPPAGIKIDYYDVASTEMARVAVAFRGILNNSQVGVWIVPADTPIQSQATQPPRDSDILIRVDFQVNCLMPLSRYVFGDGGGPVRTVSGISMVHIPW